MQRNNTSGGLKGWCWRYEGTIYLFNLTHFIFHEACRIFRLKGAFGRTASMIYLHKIYMIYLKRFKFN